MLKALYVAGAGAAGTLARYLLDAGLARVTPRFPLGTFSVNVLGSLVIGFVVVMMAARGEADQRLRLIITAGFLGGFTTYSAFALETVTLLERRQTGMAALYVGATLVTAVLGCWLGMALARLLR